MPRLRLPRLSLADVQGPLGAAAVTGSVGWLTSAPWALLTAGCFLLVAAAADVVDSLRYGDDEPARREDAY